MPTTPQTDLAGSSIPGPSKSRGVSDDLGVYADAKTYYTAEDRHRNNRAGPRTRTYSQVGQPQTLEHTVSR
jgi:alpha,alpha-trehalase